MKTSDSIQFLLKRFHESKYSDAIIWKGRSFQYGWLAESIEHWSQKLSQTGIAEGKVVALEADFSPNAVALLIALFSHSCIAVPLTPGLGAKRMEFETIAQAEFRCRLEGGDSFTVESCQRSATHDLYADLRGRNQPGLVLFSSGSTGQSKAIVHDMARFLAKFKDRRRCHRTIAFLLFDHIGGINTLFYVLSNGGCLVTVENRQPDTVLAAIEQYQVELLPTSPTFLNLVLLSEAYKRHPAHCLRMITYGTEPMHDETLGQVHKAFPNAELLQTYGMSEMGILRSKSESSGSLWVKIGGEGFATRVVDGVLHVKAQSAMLGYLNAPSPFTDDGWLNTGDVVEVKGDYILFKGRKSEIINVGGEKVYPVEVENTILQMDNVRDATVFGEPNAFTGQVVCAEIVLHHPEDPAQFKRRLHEFCRKKMARHKVPLKLSFAEESRVSLRLKKQRLANADIPPKLGGNSHDPNSHPGPSTT